MWCRSTSTGCSQIEWRSCWVKPGLPCWPGYCASPRRPRRSSRPTSWPGNRRRSATSTTSDRGSAFRSRARHLVILFAHVMQVRAAGRAVSRSAEIGLPQRSHTRYSPVATRWAARSRSSRSTRACLSMACTWARSNATVAPSGSCSSSLVVRADASTMPSHWRINESISRTVRARSSSINSFAARRCAGESPAGSVGSSTTSPTKRASYPFRQPQQRGEPLDLEPGRGVRCEFPVLQSLTCEQDPLVLGQIPRLLTEVDSTRQFIPPAE